MKSILNILKIISIIFIIYGLIVISLIGTNRLFNLFYLISGITLLLFVLSYEKIDQRIAKALLIFLGFIFLCFIYFIHTSFYLLTPYSYLARLCFFRIFSGRFFLFFFFFFLPILDTWFRVEVLSGT